MDPEMVEKTIWGFLKTRGNFLGILIIRTVVYWGVYRGTLILGNYHLGLYFTPQPKERPKNFSTGTAAGNAAAVRGAAAPGSAARGGCFSKGGNLGYCPHPVTVYIRGPIKGYI